MSHVPTVLKSDRSVFDKMLPVDDNGIKVDKAKIRTHQYIKLNTAAKEIQQVNPVSNCNSFKYSWKILKFVQESAWRSDRKPEICHMSRIRNSTTKAWPRLRKMVPPMMMLPPSQKFGMANSYQPSLQKIQDPFLALELVTRDIRTSRWG